MIRIVLFWDQGNRYVRTRQYRAIVGLYNIPHCISFAIRKATRMESDIIDADYRTRAFSSLIMARSVPSGSRPVWEFPLEFFGTTGHNAKGLPFVRFSIAVFFFSFFFLFWHGRISFIIYIVPKYIVYVFFLLH